MINVNEGTTFILLFFNERILMKFSKLKLIHIKQADK